MIQQKWTLKFRELKYISLKKTTSKLPSVKTDLRL